MSESESSESEISTQVKELQRLWKAYEEKPADFEGFDILQQPEIES